MISEIRTGIEENKRDKEEWRNTIKTPITSADMLNDRVLPFFAERSLPMLRILTDRGTEYCGRAEHHDYEFYLAVNDIEHTKTKA